MLTAVNHETTVVEGLEEHAEDYIVKPFSPGELVARVRRVLRRIGEFAYDLEPKTRIDERLLIDFPNRTAIVDGRSETLTPTETKLLYILMRKAGQTVPTDYILRRLCRWSRCSRIGCTSTSTGYGARSKTRRTSRAAVTSSPSAARAIAFAT